jgi:hypothetical protein
MSKLLKSFFLVSFILFFFPNFVFAEDITITTYYPSPYGTYNYLQTDKLGVGDTNGDTFFTSADVPTTSGQTWIAGFVGIGTTDMSDGKQLHVGGADGSILVENEIDVVADGSAADPSFTWENDSDVGMYRGGNDILAFSTAGVERMRIGATGMVGIGMAPAYALDVTGQIRMSGAAGAKMVLDVAEVIPVADDVEESDVVCIDNTVGKYQFAKSKTADSQLVAGVISSTGKDGKSIPALFVGDAEQKQKENPNQKYKYLTIAGQIAVKVCLEGGTIKKGDLLTSSSAAGYAMKSQAKQLGTIIGKALEDFDGEKGAKGTIIALSSLM